MRMVPDLRCPDDHTDALDSWPSRHGTAGRTDRIHTPDRPGPQTARGTAARDGPPFGPTISLGFHACHFAARRRAAAADFRTGFRLRIVRESFTALRALIAGRRADRAHARV